MTRYSGQEGNTASDSYSCATDFVEVIPNSIVKILDVYLSGNRTVATYDSDKRVVRCLTDTSVSDTELIVKLLENERYIRATGKTGIAPSFKYLSHESNKKVDVYKKLNGYTELYHNSTLKPVMSIIDDDTWGSAYVSELKEFCDTLGIKISFACLTSRFEQSGEEGLADLLLSYERQGFGILTHGYTQGDFYNAGESRDIVLAEDDLVHGLQDLHKKGFTDYKACWVTPFGRYDDDLKALAIRWGFDSLVRYDYTQKVENPYELSPNHRYELYRYAFADETHLDTIKSLIDNAVSCNGWVMIGVHSAQSANRTEAFRNAFTELVSYARNQGCEIRTLNEELRRRMPIYNNYEKF